MTNIIDTSKNLLISQVKDSEKTPQHNANQGNNIKPNVDFEKQLEVKDIINENIQLQNKSKSCFKDEKPIKHREVLQELLKEIQPVNFREYLDLPPDEDIKQKHIVVAVVKQLLEIAKDNSYNLCKVFDYTYIYNGAYWQKMDREDVKKFLGEVALKMGCYEYDARHFDFKDKLYKQFFSDAHFTLPEINEKKSIINLQNGTFEFTNSGGSLRHYDANDFLTYQLPFSYNQEADCPMFDKYLKSVLPDENSRLVLQEFAGYIFTNLNLEKMLVLSGTGSNGKSVFFNILTTLLGKQNVLTYSLGLFKHENNRAMLVDKLLNYSSEKGNELNPDILKALVSREPLQARLKYGNSFTLHNKARFVLNANELPKETEQTEAFFRRWIIIPFDITISEADRDVNLADKIIEFELDGVFNWLKIGLERLLKNEKFTICNKSNEALANFKRQSDSVALFIEEFNFKSSKSNKTALTDLYQRYKNFCSDDGYKAVGKNKFSVRLENKKFERTRLNNGSTAFYIEIIINKG